MCHEYLWGLLLLVNVPLGGRGGGGGGGGGGDVGTFRSALMEHRGCLWLISSYSRLSDHTSGVEVSLDPPQTWHTISNN